MMNERRESCRRNRISLLFTRDTKRSKPCRSHCLTKRCQFSTKVSSIIVRLNQTFNHIGVILPRMIQRGWTFASHFVSLPEGACPQAWQTHEACTKKLRPSAVKPHIGIVPRSSSFLAPTCASSFSFVLSHGPVAPRLQHVALSLEQWHHREAPLRHLHQRCSSSTNQRQLECFIVASPQHPWWPPRSVLTRNAS
jgi:hypothetical protein